MNLIVPIGKAQFAFYDENKNLLKNLMIGEETTHGLPFLMIWFGFKGSLNTSYILNISNEIHDPLEVERKPLTFKFSNIINMKVVILSGGFELEFQNTQRNTKTYDPNQWETNHRTHNGNLF